ncbi:MAG: hypothetical protein DBY05_09635 [Clostridiales bacterium]|nr:MAG: hypothetical protein DBY05_09635 [Clostridiales bacterium]
MSISANKTGGDKAERKLQNVDNHGIFQSNPKLIQSKKRFKIFEQRIAPGASENPFPKRKILKRQRDSVHGYVTENNRQNNSG